MIRTFCDLCGNTMEQVEINRDFVIAAHLPAKESEPLRPVDFSIRERSATIHLHRKCQLQLLVEQVNREIASINKKEQQQKRTKLYGEDKL